MGKKSFVCLCLIFISFGSIAQLKPADAAKAMMRGINIGNTMDATPAYSWGNKPIVEKAFDDYQKAGFTSIRIPITWGIRMQTGSPYTVNSLFMDEVEKVVDWGLKQGLILIINVHHDSWIKDSYSSTNIARFDSLWSQIASRFRNKSDSLIFEIINEPHPMSLANVNELNKRTLATIRKTNPTRIVVFSGHMWSGPSEIVQAAVPNTTDPFLMGYYHSYDPYPFGLEGPGSYGSDNDINTTKNIFQSVANWSNQRGIPVFLGEFGYTRKCEYNARMCAYATVVEFTIQYGIPGFAWDDGGDFAIYNRSTGAFNEIKDILIYTYPVSPNKLKISLTPENKVKLQWNNRTTESDSIVVERRIDNGTFAKHAMLAPNANEFIDAATVAGKSNYYRLRTQWRDSVQIQSYPIMIAVSAPKREPFFGGAVNVPGWIQAENYDKGGEGVAFHDSDNLNTGGSTYRGADGVDVEEIGSKNYSVVSTLPGEWLEYTINATKAGNYIVRAMVASANDGGGQFQLSFPGNQVAACMVPATESWTSYLYSSTDTVSLSAGVQIMRLSITKNPSFKINYIEIDKVSGVAQSSIQKVTIAPNPVKNNLHFTVSEPIVGYTLYNAAGNHFTGNIPLVYANILDVSALKKGIYFVTFETVSGKRVTEKFIKN